MTFNYNKETKESCLFTTGHELTVLRKALKIFMGQEGLRLYEANDRDVESIGYDIAIASQMLRAIHEVKAENGKTKNEDKD